MNGQEQAEQNFRAFETWVTTKTDADFREMVMHGRLNRGEICRECDFSRSALVQNPRIKEALRELEEQLRARRVLPELIRSETTPLRVKGQVRAAADSERLRRLEAENAGLRAELTELRQRLKRLNAIEALLSETGRLTR